MKRHLISALAVLAIMCGCESGIGYSSYDSTDSNFVLGDNNLVGVWDIVKYEALSRSGESLKETSNSGEISATYRKFAMTADLQMSIWYGSYETAVMTVGFGYDSSMKILMYGDTGYADVEVLTKDSLVFVGQNFAPLEWYDNASIYSVRTTCVKEQEE